MWIERLVLISVVTISVITFFIPYASAQEQKTYTIYVEPNFIYQKYVTNVMEDATKTWHNANPNINFVLTDSSSQPYDFEVEWIKDNTGDPWAGEAVISSHIMQVVLGDSFCGGTWQPYSHATLVSLATHELGHLLGLGHSNDINNVMSPNRNDFEYAFRQYQPTFLSGGYYIIPLCNLWNTGSVQFDLVDENTYPVSFFFAPTVWHPFIGPVSSVGTNFQYYTNNGCYGLNVQSFLGTCNGLGKYSYLVIGSPNEGSNAYTTVSIFLTDTTPQPQYYVPNLQAPNPLPAQLPTSGQSQSTPQYFISTNAIRGTFDPPTLVIPFGGTIAWNNDDNGMHNIQLTFPNSPSTMGQSITIPLSPSQKSYAYTLSQQGIYTYYDEIHPSMKGSIIIGSTSVPEFSSITGMITAMSIIGVIAISSKFR